jgi:hypothetical protein
VAHTSGALPGSRSVLRFPGYPLDCSSQIDKIFWETKPAA